MRSMIIAAGLVTAQAAAMVPPGMQRQYELRAVINLPGMAARLGAPIDRVERIAPGLWRVSGGSCHVDVQIESTRPATPGLSPPGFVPRPRRRLCRR